MADGFAPAHPITVPDKPALEGLEQKWAARWESEGVYRFDRTKTRAEVFSIDTPPPTVSGSLHVGHVFSFTHTDVVARFQRMRGKAVFYPMGWDDNGLPTERRVQNYFGVRCDPSLPYDAGFVAPDKPGKQPIPVSRPNFIELCARLTIEDEKVFEDLWRTLGLSVDWKLTYATIGKGAQRVSQLAFLRLLARGMAYQLEAPTLWDIDFRTAVAQAELEDREQPGAYHRIRFARPDGGYVEIDTTRPELIPACVALVAHPDDERYKPLFGSEVTTPIFGVRVPVKPHPLADPEKGTGVAMICTFGDVTDVIWWRELGLPVRAILQPNGALRPLTWGAAGWEAADPAAAQTAYDQLVNLSTSKARTRMVEMLRESGDLLGEPKPITHAVKFYEKGDRPLEILTSRQWFIKTMEYRTQLLARARELVWHPAYMQARLENWINGLSGDWCVSRQRFFGVPFPLWYRIREDGTTDYSARLVPDESRLPLDPSTDVPDGFSPAQRDVPGGFTGDPDIMDTWATSSLTPQIAGGWIEDPDLFARVFPMDVRPQGHDIIRTWLFSTVLAIGARARVAALGECRDIRLGARPRSQEDVEVEGQRRDAEGPARRARLRRRALLGGERPARHRHRLRHGPDEGRPASRDQAAERVEVRAVASRTPWTRHRGRRSRPVDDALGAGAGRDRRPRQLQLRAGARADRDVLLVVLRRLSRARQGTPLRRSGGGAGGVCQWRAAHHARRPCCACSRRSFPS